MIQMYLCNKQTAETKLFYCCWKSKNNLHDTLISTDNTRNTPNECVDEQLDDNIPKKKLQLSVHSPRSN